MKEKYNVTGMTCSACSANVEKCVKKLQGVEAVNVNLLNNSMTVVYDHKVLNSNLIIDAVKHAGYGATLPKNNNLKADETEKEISNMKKRLYISIGFLIPLMYISMGHMIGLPLPFFLKGHSNAIAFALTQLLLVLPVMFINQKFYKVGFRALLKGAPNMDSLIAIGSGAAFIYGIFAIYRIGYGLGINDYALVEKYHSDLYFESSAMILTLITFGKLLEVKSKGRTGDAIKKLIDLTPKTAKIEENGIEIERAVEELKKDDVILVRPGESIPVDGEIIFGNTSIDESALTGESIPVDKTIGSKVISATINKSGFIKFKATKVGEDTSIAQIIKLVEDASGSKAPIAKLADKISGIFVPIVIGIALITGFIWLIIGYGVEFSLSNAIAVLVISCPCALGLATPTAIMVGTGRGAENHILIKSAESLETLHEVQTVVMDKTGTITTGKPIVTDIVPFNSYDKAKLLGIAVSLEKPSEHPLSSAIVKFGEENNTSIYEVLEFKSLSGFGVQGKINNIQYYAGNIKMMISNNISVDKYKAFSNEFSKQGKTAIYFANKKEVVGILAISDVPKATSESAIKEYKKMGLEVVMLTGDNKVTANAIKDQLGISTVIAEVLPQDKENEIKKIQEAGKKVAMIGDGVNDAPALKRADVGIAIGAGTDVAIEAADIVLVKNDLLDGVKAIKLSKAVIKNIKENLFWAFFYNALCIPIAAGVFYPLTGLKLNPMLGAAAMSLSSVFVVGNALRLKSFKCNFDCDKIENNSALSNKSENEEINQMNDIQTENIQTENNKMEDIKMEKIINIEGMACEHCSKRVKEALETINGAKVQVQLENKCAIVSLQESVSDEELKEKIIQAGYTVSSIK